MLEEIHGTAGLGLTAYLCGVCNTVVGHGIKDTWKKKNTMSQTKDPSFHLFNIFFPDLS